MTAKTRTLILALALFGLGASGWSSYVHYSLLTRPGYTSFCDVNDTLSCTQAYLSAYGSLAGIPVALLGVIFFALVLTLAAVAPRGTAQARENVPAYIFALSTVGLAFVLYLAWASFFRLNAVCLLCLATYAAVIGIFIVSGGATKFPMTALPSRATKDVSAMLRSPVALVLAVVLSVGAVSLISAFPREAPAAAQAGTPDAPQPAPLTDGQRYELLRWFDVQPKTPVPVDAGGAKILIVKFNDYQCPACRQVYFDYKALLARYAQAGQVKHVTKHYPLEGECNASVPGGTHRAACEAAAAVVMAASKGASEKMEDWLFANQATLTRDSIKKAVADVAGIADFDARYEQALTEVRADAGVGAQLQVKSTPTFFVNGRRIEGGLPLAYLQAVLEHELKR